MSPVAVDEESKKETVMRQTGGYLPRPPKPPKTLRRGRVRRDSYIFRVS